MTKPLILVAAAALIDADDRVLIAKRPPGKPMAGLWEFPGGKVKDGETPEARSHARIGRRTRHHPVRRLPRPIRVRLAHLRRLPLVDAALHHAPMGR